LVNKSKNVGDQFF